MTAEVIEIMRDHPDLAMVGVAGLRRVVNVAQLQDEGLVPGDWVLVHAGVAVSPIEVVDALAMLLEQTGIDVLDTDAAEPLDQVVAVGRGLADHQEQAGTQRVPGQPCQRVVARSWHAFQLP